MLKKVETEEKKRGQYIKMKEDEAIAGQLTIDNLCVWMGFCLSAVVVCCCHWALVQAGKFCAPGSYLTQLL